MKKIILTCTFIIISIYSFAQHADSVKNKLQVQLNEVVITATRTERKLQDIPAQVDIINPRDIEEFPINNIDDILKTTANVYVNRSWGIYSKNSSVSMRGLEGSERTLIMVDGVPKNKIAGGAVNWHNINPDNVEKIEIIKGPSSALYGNNAMGGAINIITKTPEKRISGIIKSSYGTYHTWGNSVNLLGNEVKENKGFYWNLNGFFRKGDGYVYEPPEFLDETDIKTKLKEFGGGVKLGYQLNSSNQIEIIYDYFDEFRGTGRQVYTEDGSYDGYITNQVKSRYIGKIGTFDLNANLYYSQEEYHQQNESLNSTAEFRLYDASSLKKDMGLWVVVSKHLFQHHFTSLGMEFKSGNVMGDEIYRTSPDEISYRSAMDIYGFFLQDEIDFANSRFKLIAGIRGDLIRFYDGHQQILNPSKTTGFSESFAEDFEENQWFALSPKVALQYSLNGLSKIYASVSTGYKPPKLKDLSQTGKINKGFRLANPNVKPESLINYELGYNRTFIDKIKLNSAVYYSIGNNFQYTIGTGDSIDTGGNSIKPVLYTDNIAKIEVIGGELSLSYYINTHLTIEANYAYNHSTILDYEVAETNPSKDLSGKYIIEVSPHLIYAGINWNNKYFESNINCNYVDEQWFDDENTILIDDYFLVNLRIAKNFKKRIIIYLNIHDLFDVRYIDRKGRVSPGRFITGGIQINI
jgi:iron complex outermembrane receptor protein